MRTKLEPSHVDVTRVNETLCSANFSTGMKKKLVFASKYTLEFKTLEDILAYLIGSYDILHQSILDLL